MENMTVVDVLTIDVVQELLTDHALDILSGHQTFESGVECGCSARAVLIAACFVKVGIHPTDKTKKQVHEFRVMAFDVMGGIS